MTYVSAIETLKKFYKDTSSDIATLGEIYQAWGRDLSDPEKNKQWVANKLTHLKHYDLVVPIYSFGRRRELSKIQLTEEGKKVLGRVESSSNKAIPQSNTVTPETVLRDVKILQDQLPNFNIIFRIEPKEVQTS